MGNSVAGQLATSVVSAHQHRQPHSIQRQHSDNNSPTAGGNKNSSVNDELLLQLIHNFSQNRGLNPQSNSNQGCGMQAPQPITLNQIKEEQQKKRVSSTPPLIITSGAVNGSANVTNCTSPSAIRRSASLTNAVAYAMGSAPIPCPVVSTQYFNPNNIRPRLNIPHPTRPPTSVNCSLTHSNSTSQLQQFFGNAINNSSSGSLLSTSPSGGGGSTQQSNYNQLSGFYTTPITSSNQQRTGSVPVSTIATTHSNQP